MPYINIRLACKLTSEQRHQLNTETTQLMHTVMGKNPDVTVVHIMESEHQQWSVNSKVLDATDPIGAFVDIKVTAGTNTPNEKADMIMKTVRMLKNTVGVIQEACYVVIDDLPANSWGYDGITQEERASRKNK